MRFSVLVPVYNVENYIEQCLDSILGQTFQDFELVLVDDGSTDRSGIICDEYQTLYPKQIKVIHKENQGLISARRIGIKEATGEFCIFVDSDDFVEVNLLEEVDAYLKRDLEVDVLLYSFTYYRNGKKDKRFQIVKEDGYVWSGESKREIYEKISCGSDITSIWTKAIHTSILKEDPTDYSLYYGKNMAEDLLQSLYPLTKARKIMYTDKTLYNYRINNESISRNFQPETLDKKNTIHVYEKVMEYLELWDLNNEQLRHCVNMKWFGEAMHAIFHSYDACANKEEQKELMDYDWNNLIPEEARGVGGKYVSESHRVVYSMWCKNNYRGIQIFFWKKKCYQKVKALKRKISG